MKKDQSGEAFRVTRGFAKRLEAARVAAGFDTMQEFAGRIGVSPARYRRWEAAETEPPLHLLVKIKHEVGKSLDFLICGSDHNDA